ncbi:MAG: AlwI family type II restriction endonuclease [Pseudomonadales bacterium]|nr:AlwI family type II restriction endonuclease [Bacteroidota bacterium]MCB9813769.1 AlwI family type II restriction endonuclease [Pseudomonadales bacterium]
MRFWSVSTTIRNPERIRSFLQVLKLMEGETWTNDNQKRFQVLLIQYKIYGFGESQFHNTLTDEQNSWLDSDNVSYEQAENILDSKDYVGGGDMRGRQSFNPLEKMGLAYLDENSKIRITSFGNYFLQENYDLGEVFFRSFIKWQYPNPDANKYKAIEGYDIKPFVATLHLISKVNKICEERGMKVKGVSRIEFAIFFVSLSNYQDIENTAQQLVDFRIEFESIKDRDKQKEFTETYFQNHFSNYESWHNAKEYTDNIIRYFRLTRYIYIRGNGWYIDIEPRRKVEINALLESDNASSLVFNSKEEYIQYIGNSELPILPWEKSSTLQEVINNLREELEIKYNELLKLGISLPVFPENIVQNSEINILKSHISSLREYRRILFEKETHFYSQSTENIEVYVETLSKIFQISTGRPVELERSVTLGLNALNDAINIKPNYPVGDDNEPTFTAPANKPDIECFYENFNAICEVTLLTNRSQWYNEGQPVMRHIRDFEKAYSEKDTYCLFIAPKLHRDTVNTFWVSVKYEYEGQKQKIVPISITQFIQLLEILKENKERGVFLTHQKLRELYDSIIEVTNQVNNSEEWIKSIPKLIDTWKKSIAA